MMDWYGGSGAMHLGGGVLMLLFWVAVVVLAVWAGRTLFPPARGSEHDSAFEVLKRRYAAGELNQAEYEQARRAIG
jgi:putative membrane protein